jgi:hypothetical protein
MTEVVIFVGLLIALCAWGWWASKGAKVEPVEIVLIPIDDGDGQVIPEVVVVEPPPLQSEMQRLMEGRKITIKIPEEHLADIPVHKVVRAKIRKAVKKGKRK